MFTKEEREKYKLIINFMELYFDKGEKKVIFDDKEKNEKTEINENKKKIKSKKEENLTERKNLIKDEEKKKKKPERIDTSELDAFVAGLKEEEVKEKKRKKMKNSDDNDLFNEDKGPGKFFTTGFQDIRQDQSRKNFTTGNNFMFQTAGGMGIKIDQKKYKKALKFFESQDDDNRGKISPVTVNHEDIQQKFDIRENGEIRKKVSKNALFDSFKKHPKKRNNLGLFEATLGELKKRNMSKSEPETQKNQQEIEKKKKRKEFGNFTNLPKFGNFSNNHDKNKGFTFGFAGAGGKQLNIDQDKIKKAMALLKDDNEDDNFSMNFQGLINKKNVKKVKKFKALVPFKKNSRNMNRGKRKVPSLKIKKAPFQIQKEVLKRGKPNENSKSKKFANPKRKVKTDMEMKFRQNNFIIKGNYEKFSKVEVDLKMLDKYDRLRKNPIMVEPGHKFTSNGGNVFFKFENFKNIFSDLRDILEDEYNIISQLEFTEAIKGFIYLKIKNLKNSKKSENFLKNFSLDLISSEFIHHHSILISRKNYFRVQINEKSKILRFLLNQIFNRFRCEKILNSCSCLLKIFRERAFQKQTIVLRVEKIISNNSKNEIILTDGHYYTKMITNVTKISDNSLQTKNTMSSEEKIFSLIKTKKLKIGQKIRFCNSTIYPEGQKPESTASEYSSWVIETPFNSISKISDQKKKLGFCLENKSKLIKNIFENSGIIDQVDLTIIHVKGACMTDTGKCLTEGLKSSKFEGKQVKIKLRVVDTLDIFLKREKFSYCDLEINYADASLYGYLQCGTRLILRNARFGRNSSFYDLFDEFDGNHVEILKVLKANFRSKNFTFLNVKRSMLNSWKKEVFGIDSSKISKDKTKEKNWDLTLMENLEKIENGLRVPFFSFWVRYITHKRSKAVFYLTKNILITIKIYNYNGRKEEKNSSLWSDISPWMRSSAIIFYDLEYSGKEENVDIILDSGEEMSFDVYNFKFELHNSTYQCKTFYQNMGNFFLKNYKGNDEMHKELKKKKVSKKLKDTGILFDN